MVRVQAVYAGGVLRSLSPLPLHEHQRVELIVETDETCGQTAVRCQQLSGRPALDALTKGSEGRERLRRKTGVLPDSSEEIRKVRMRDL